MMSINRNLELEIEKAAQILATGELVAIPTETVYGLAANAQQDAAVAKIFVAKGRPANHPLIVHVLEASDADYFASEIPDFAQKLMQAFWPGPLTVIVPEKKIGQQRPQEGMILLGLEARHTLSQELC